MRKDSLKDYFYKKAKKERYPARSIYKLEEIDRKYKIIKAGAKVLDLGASPGSWTKYCSEKVGAKGLVVGIDKEPLKFDAPNVRFIEGDVFKVDISIFQDKFDVVLSDLAPKTTGTKEVDQARSMELARKAFWIARQTLKKGGHFICKVFQGPDVNGLIEDMRGDFEWVRFLKPSASRKESFEIYIIGYFLLQQEI